MTLSIRPLSIRLRVAYMATAMREATGNPVATCEAGSTWDRLTQEGWGESGERHPYTALWNSVANFYHSQGLDKLCDAEIFDRYEAAVTVGFKTVAGQKVPATSVHKAVSLWRNQGWFRYEHQHAGRMKLAKRLGLIGLFAVGVPVVSDL